MVLYDNDSFPFFVGFNNKNMIKTFNIGMFPSTTTKTHATSYLKENINNTILQYPASNLTHLDIPKPWVEGVEGNGVGEKIYYYMKDIEHRSILAAMDKIYRSKWTLYVSNGYVSYNRPDLFWRNNRIKELKIIQPESSEYKIITLEDTPNIQTISLPDDPNFDGDMLTMEILSVYEGSSYSDTCLNFIIQYDEPITIE